ncbi:quinol dehydrogenase ferredoxin subunit NapH [Sulfurospirillum sp. 1612]|uniref:quinol dehydrogenase ferredoxin subunit NapH n=1 Tax=Sulfurospirillum sp. 1612 TaxID=3094835 RepID=UPI002F95FC09
MSKYRFLLARRTTQIMILVLYFGANAYGWKMLAGTLSSSTILGTIPLADPFAILQMLVAGATLGADILLGGLIILLFYGLIGGRAFCSWVCPINMVTDSANWLRRKLYLDDAERKVWVSRKVRYWVLGLTLIVSAIVGVGAFEFVSPITILNRGIVFGFGMSMAVVAVIFLFDLFVLKNGWCGHICPLGGFYSLVGKFAPLSVMHNQANCTLCMKCKDICPEKQVLHTIGKKSGKIVDIECTNCGRCIEVCEDDALKFTIFDITKDIKGEI